MCKAITDEQDAQVRRTAEATRAALAARPLKPCSDCGTLTKGTPMLYDPTAIVPLCGPCKAKADGTATAAALRAAGIRPLTPADKALASAIATGTPQARSVEQAAELDRERAREVANFIRIADFQTSTIESVIRAARKNGSLVNSLNGQLWTVIIADHAFSAISAVKRAALERWGTEAQASDDQGGEE